MSRSGLKWPAVGLASLMLVLLGAHLAWEQYRVRLHTPKGTIRIGMTRTEARAVFGFAGFVEARQQALGRSATIRTELWFLNEGVVGVDFDGDDRVTDASFGPYVGSQTAIPRPSLFGYVRSWFGRRE
jgi:hypothetical protein